MLSDRFLACDLLYYIVCVFVDVFKVFGLEALEEIIELVLVILVQLEIIIFIHDIGKIGAGFVCQVFFLAHLELVKILLDLLFVERLERFGFTEVTNLDVESRIVKNVVRF